MTPDAKAEIAATYSTAADHFDAPAVNFFRYFGDRTVERAALPSGAMVLDVCCGTGSSAIPAARAVAPGGRVIGVDLAQGLLALARAKATEQGIANVEFRQADFEQVYFRPASFDAAICVFGIFFFPDMPAALSKMWRFLRPGGRLAITTWRAGSLEPIHTVFWDAVRRVRPELYKPSGARARLAGPGAVERLFADAGISQVEITHEDGEQTLEAPEDAWTIVMGSSYRRTIEQLTPVERAAVREECLAKAGGSIHLPVCYAIARAK